MRYLGLLWVLLGFNSCLYFGGATYLDKKANATENSLEITTKQVTVVGSLKVVLTNSDSHTALMTNDLFELLEIEVEGDTTVIKPINKIRVYGLGYFEIHLGTKNLDVITVATDRPISTPEPLTGNNLTLNLNSAVRGKISSRVNNLTLNINSVEPLAFVGRANSLILTTNSFAVVNLKRFVAENETLNNPTGSIVWQ